MTNRELSHRLRLALASITYILAGVFDYFMTLEGIITGRNEEGNPIIQVYIDRLGLQKGLLFYKLFMSILIVIGAIVLDIAYEKKSRGSKPLRLSLYLLYFGAIATLLAGLSWW